MKKKTKRKASVKRVKLFKYEVVVLRLRQDAVTVEVEAANEEQASEKAHELYADGVFDDQWDLIEDSVDVTEITKL